MSKMISAPAATTCAAMAAAGVLLGLVLGTALSKPKKRTTKQLRVRWLDDTYSVVKTDPANNVKR